MRSEIYSFLTVAEGGIGQKDILLMLAQVGIKAKPTTSSLIGHSAVIVYGNQRVQNKACRIIY